MKIPRRMLHPSFGTISPREIARCCEGGFGTGKKLREEARDRAKLLVRELKRNGPSAASALHSNYTPDNDDGDS